MKNIISNLLWITGFFAIFFVSCDDDIDPVIEELNYSRVLSVTNLEISIVDIYKAEIDFDVDDNADYYLLSFYKDSMEIDTDHFVETDTVYTDDVPVTLAFDSEQEYSVVVQGVSDSIDNSKTMSGYFETGSEDILDDLEIDNIGQQDVTPIWEAGSDVNYFKVYKGSSLVDSVRITDDEITAGEATIEGLDYDTEYTIEIYRDGSTKKRGSLTVTTLPDGVSIESGSDVSEIINNSTSNVFLLEKGVTYDCSSTINVDRSITILGRGGKTEKFDGEQTMPVISATFKVSTTSADALNIENVELDGSLNDQKYVVQTNSDGISAFGTLSMSGCYIHDYSGQFFYFGKQQDLIMNTVSIDDCIITDITSSIIDIRYGCIENISVTNSTFSNCASGKYFIEMDGSGKGNEQDNGSNKPAITVTNCSFYNVCNGSSKGFFYGRWYLATCTMDVENNIFAFDTDQEINLYYSDSKNLDYLIVTLSNNYYYLGSGLLTQDDYGTEVTADPFTDAVNSDFTLTNDDLILAEAGDPRWY